MPRANRHRGDAPPHLTANRNPRDTPPQLSADEQLRRAVLAVLDAEDALRAAGVRSESVPKLLEALRHAVSRVTAVTKTLPRRAADE